MKTRSQSFLYKELRETAEHKGFPIDVLFELTGRCNLNCKMCYVHTMTNADAFLHELSSEKWLDIFDQAISAGMMFATLSGGECLLRPDFRKLYLYLYEHGVQLIVKTNGILLNDDYIGFFKSFPPMELQISLYGTNDSEYYDVTEMRVSDLVLNHIRAISESGLKYRIQITPCGEAKPFFYGIIDYLIEKKYPFQISQFLLSPREGEKDDKCLDISPDDICDYMCYIAEQKGKKLKRISPETLPMIGTGGENVVEKKHCTAGKNRCQIDWRGNMHPCVALPTISASVISLGYLNAWSVIQKESELLHFPEKCSSCAYKNACKPCYAARSNNLNSSDCNDNYCELVKEKICRGLIKFDIIDSV